MKTSHDLKLIEIKDDNNIPYTYLIPESVAEYINKLEAELDKEVSIVTNNKPYRQK